VRRTRKEGSRFGSVLSWEGKAAGEALRAHAGAGYQGGGLGGEAWAAEDHHVAGGEVEEEGLGQSWRDTLKLVF
jgi:hypothetical protein